MTLPQTVVRSPRLSLPVFPRKRAHIILSVSDPEPQQRFLSWLTDYGISYCAKRVGVTRVTVQSWKRSTLTDRRTIKPQHARICIALSMIEAPCKDGKGPLALADFYGDVAAELRSAEGKQ